VAFSDDGLPIANASLMRRALEYTRWLDVPVVAHEEDKDLAGKGYMHEGAVSASLGCLGIPAAAEEAMVARDIVLAEHTGGHLHLAHLSTKGSLRMVREAKARGLSVTCEVTPHHFALSDKELMKFDSDFKMNPPLRTEADIQALLEALADGTVDAIATDHAPHGWDDKEVELPIAAFGVIGLETALPLTLELLVNRKVISLSRAIEPAHLGSSAGLPPGPPGAGQPQARRPGGLRPLRSQGEGPWTGSFIQPARQVLGGRQHSPLQGLDALPGESEAGRLLNQFLGTWVGGTYRPARRQDFLLSTKVGYGIPGVDQPLRPEQSRWATGRAAGAGHRRHRQTPHRGRRVAAGPASRQPCRRPVLGSMAGHGADPPPWRPVLERGGLALHSPLSRRGQQHCGHQPAGSLQAEPGMGGQGTAAA
jgi:hypothetical protein